jgi:hypothetical protein
MFIFIRVIGYEKMIVKQVKIQTLYLVNIDYYPYWLPIIDGKFPMPAFGGMKHKCTRPLLSVIDTAWIAKKSKSLKLLRINADRFQVLQDAIDIAEMFFFYLDGLVVQGE